jgi:hypothetical protein
VAVLFVFSVYLSNNSTSLSSLLTAALQTTAETSSAEPADRAVVQPPTAQVLATPRQEAAGTTGGMAKMPVRNPSGPVISAPLQTAGLQQSSIEAISLAEEQFAAGLMKNPDKIIQIRPEPAPRKQQKNTEIPAADDAVLPKLSLQSYTHTDRKTAGISSETPPVPAVKTTAKTDTAPVSAKTDNAKSDHPVAVEPESESVPAKAAAAFSQPPLGRTDLGMTKPASAVVVNPSHNLSHQAKYSEVSGVELEVLTSLFVGAYERGNVEELMTLFDDQARANNKKGKLAADHKSYRWATAWWLQQSRRSTCLRTACSFPFEQPPRERYPTCPSTGSD